MSSASHVSTTPSSRTANTRRPNSPASAGQGSVATPTLQRPPAPDETDIARLFREWTKARSAWDASPSTDDDPEKNEPLAIEDERLLEAIGATPAATAVDVRTKMEVYRDVAWLKAEPYVKGPNQTLEDPFLAGLFVDVERVLVAGDVQLRDHANDAWRHVTQLFLILQALTAKAKVGHSITGPEMKAAVELADELHNDVASVQIELGHTEAELGI